MNRVGDKALKVGFIRVKPGMELQVAKNLEERAKELISDQVVILKGFGFWDIILIYEALDFEHYITKAGPIEGILNSYVCLCFPYLGSTSSEIIDKIKKSTFTGLVLLKYNTNISGSMVSIEERLINYLNSHKIIEFNILGTIGWNEIIFIVNRSKLEEIIEELQSLNYYDTESNNSKYFILKTFTHIAINYEKLPKKEMISNSDDHLSTMDNLKKILEDDFKLGTIVSPKILPTIHVSANPRYFKELHAFWRGLHDNFHCLESFGEYDFIISPTSESRDKLTWSYFLSRLLYFRSLFGDKINATSTNFNWENIFDVSEKDILKLGKSLQNNGPGLSRKFIDFDYDKLEKIFGTNSAMLANHFFTLNSLSQNSITGSAFHQMMKYPQKLMELGDIFQKNEGGTTVSYLALIASMVIAVGAELRSYGTNDNIQRNFSHFSKLNGGAQRALLAIESVPHYIFSRLNSSWHGFVVVQDPKFSHFNEILLVPTEALWKPSQWWALYHEIAHILIDRSSWLREDDNIVINFLDNKEAVLGPAWFKLLVELGAEVIGFRLGFFGDLNLFYGLLWEHIFNIDPLQKQHIDITTYLIRSFFVELFERAFIDETDTKIAPEDFNDTDFLYRAFIKHITKVEQIVGKDFFDESELGKIRVKLDDEGLMQISIKKLSFAAANAKLFKELYPFAQYLFTSMENLEKDFGISFTPEDGRNHKNTLDIIKTIKNGQVWWDEIQYPESVLYHIFKEFDSTKTNKDNNFKSEIAILLSFWNAKLRLINEEEIQLQDNI